MCFGGRLVGLPNNFVKLPRNLLTCIEKTFPNNHNIGQSLAQILSINKLIFLAVIRIFQSEFLRRV